MILYKYQIVYMYTKGKKHQPAIYWWKCEVNSRADGGGGGGDGGSDGGSGSCIGEFYGAVSAFLYIKALCAAKQQQKQQQQQHHENCLPKMGFDRSLIGSAVPIRNCFFSFTVYKSC